MTFGTYDCEPWRDDWDDKPYEHNRGEVYDRYVEMHSHYKLGRNIVLEPCDIVDPNSQWSMKDFLLRLTPCLLIVPKELLSDNEIPRYDKYVGHPNVAKIYLGDTYNEVWEKLDSLESYDKTSMIVDQWVTLHDFQNEPPESLAKSVLIGGAELLENYQFNDTVPDLEKVKDEIADVMIYLIRLCNHYNWDYYTLIKNKLRKNDKKYPSPYSERRDEITEEDVEDKFVKIVKRVNSKIEEMVESETKPKRRRIPSDEKLETNGKKRKREPSANGTHPTYI